MAEKPSTPSTSDIATSYMPGGDEEVVVSRFNLARRIWQMIKDRPEFKKNKDELQRTKNLSY